MTSTAIQGAPDTVTAEPPAGPQRSGPSWARIFVGGLVLWSATVLITFVTGNANLVPTIILLGSFLVPVAFVTYAFGHADQVVTAQRIFTAFVYGGVLGVLGASVLEAAFLRQPSGPAYVWVGLIEEAVKLAALWMVARRLPRYTMRDGIVLGAAVGFGFAAFESAGYAFNALFAAGGPSLLSLVETEVLRGILAPVGHGLWTAILGGTLFGVAARRGRLRLSGAVLGSYLLVAFLHGLWDASRGIAVWLTLVLTGTPVQWLLIRLGRAPEVTPAQVHLFTALSWGLLALDALLGVLILRRRWRRATTPARRPPAAAALAAALVAALVLAGCTTSTAGVVTNAHVGQGADSFQVTLANGKQYPARLVGSFTADDLAVLHVDAGGLHPATFADSSRLQVGDVALAIGNPLGLQSSVTEGIVSALGRTVSEDNGVALPSVIQTSAPSTPATPTSWPGCAPARRSRCRSPVPTGPGGRCGSPPASSQADRPAERRLPATTIAAEGPYHLIVDDLWGAPAEAAFAALARGAAGAGDGPPRIRCIQVGIAAGETAELPAITLRSVPVELSGSRIGGPAGLDDTADAYDRRVVFVP